MAELLPIVLLKLIIKLIFRINSVISLYIYTILYIYIITHYAMPTFHCFSLAVWLACVYYYFTLLSPFTYSTFYYYFSSFTIGLYYVTIIFLSPNLPYFNFSYYASFIFKTGFFYLFSPFIIFWMLSFDRPKPPSHLLNYSFEQTNPPFYNSTVYSF